MCITTKYCPDCGGDLIDAEEAASNLEQKANESLRTEPSDPEGTASYCRSVARSVRTSDYYCESCDRDHDEEDFCWGFCGEQVTFSDLAGDRR